MEQNEDGASEHGVMDGLENRVKSLILTISTKMARLLPPCPRGLKP